MSIQAPMLKLGTGVHMYIHTSVLRAPMQTGAGGRLVTGRGLGQAGCPGKSQIQSVVVDVGFLWVAVVFSALS